MSHDKHKYWMKGTHMLSTHRRCMYLPSTHWKLSEGYTINSTHTPSTQIIKTVYAL